MKVLILVFGLFYSASNFSMYFWEFRGNGSGCGNGSVSCCLCAGGMDICNPNVACTRHPGYDLQGILNYINRISIADKAFNDKGIAFPYVKIIKQAELMVRNLMSSSVQLFYRYDVPQRAVSFLHETIDSMRSAEKNSKNSTVSSAEKPKESKEDAVIAYMTQMGLARPLK